MSKARPIWNGHISFGLVNIPVYLYSAESRSDGVSFHLIDKTNNSRVRTQRINEATGEPVEWENVIRGYELDDDSYITFTDDELKTVAVESSQAVEIEEFVDLKEIPHAYFDKPYYTVPAKKGDKGYVLLREALKKSGKVGIAKVVLRTREYLSALIPEGDALNLYILRYQYELRAPEQSELPTGTLKDYKVSPKEIEIAQQLIETMSGDFEPEKYKDEYRDKLLAWIEERAEKGGKAAPKGDDDEGEEATGGVIDIMSLLKESMKGAKGGKAKPDKKKTG